MRAKFRNTNTTNNSIEGINFMEDFRPPVLPVVADLGVIVIDRLHARPKKKRIQYHPMERIVLLCAMGLSSFNILNCHIEIGLEIGHSISFRTEITQKKTKRRIFLLAKKIG